MVTFPNAMGCHQVSYVVYVLFASMSIYNEILCGAMPRCLQKSNTTVIHATHIPTHPYLLCGAVRFVKNLRYTPPILHWQFYCGFKLKVRPTCVLNQRIFSKNLWLYYQTDISYFRYGYFLRAGLCTGVSDDWFCCGCWMYRNVIEYRISYQYSV